MTKDASPEDFDPDGRLIGRVSHAARHLQAIEEQHRDAASRLAEALLAAHECGYTWSKIAQAAELGSAETARIRAYRAKDDAAVPPALRWRRQRGSAPRPESPSPGLSVTEAAKHLGISRQTVYVHIRNGKLNSILDEAGRPRVLLEDD